MITAIDVFIFFAVAVVICFFLCWSPYHAQRLLFAYLTLTGSWNSRNTHIHHYLYLSSGKANVCRLILTEIIACRFGVILGMGLCPTRTIYSQQRPENCHSPQSHAVVTSHAETPFVKTKNVHGSTLSTPLRRSTAAAFHTKVKLES